MDASTRLAVYERTVHASLERIWENVMDWAHLPWLHRSTFVDIAHRESGRWGWRARVCFAPAEAGSESVIELVRRPDEGRYVARTLEGAGRGGEIWTSLDPRGPQRTQILVAFHLPGLRGAAAKAVGEGLTRTYARLWDEDEAMMTRREAELARRRRASSAAPTSIELGPRDELRRRLPLQIELGSGRYQLLELDGELVAHSSVCPHWLGPLEAGEIRDGLVRCPWHGYVFDLRSGACREGRAAPLDAAPAVVVDPESERVTLVLGGAAEPAALSERSARR